MTEFIYFGAIALTVCLNAVGASIGQGLASKTALDAIDRQPSAQQDIARTAMLGLALIETTAIIGAFIAALLLFDSQNLITSAYSNLATIGIVCALCLSGFVVGIVSSFPTQAACISVARQPFFGQKILRFMIITQSLIQTPIIFGLIITLFIKNLMPSIHTTAESLRLIASGLCIGLGSIGPAIGLGLFARQACTSIGTNKQAYGKILSFTLISQAIIETPIIFSLIIAILILVVTPGKAPLSLLDGTTMFCAGLCMGLGTIGPGISSGKTAAAACQFIALNPKNYSTLSRTSMFAQGLIETSAIYSIIIAFGLLLFR